MRLSVPLRSHRHAKTAAVAYACAKHAGKGEEMAHALFTQNDLTKSGCRSAASKLGLDMDAFDACVDGSEGESLMMADVEQAKAIKFRGLPTLWVGTKELLGAHSAEDLRKVIEEQRKGEATATASLPQHWMWLMMGLAFVTLAVVSLVRRPPAS